MWLPLRERETARRLGRGLALATALALAGAACGKPAPPEPAPAGDDDEARLVAVTCAPVVARETRDALSLRGTLAPEPAREARVAAPMAGVIASVAVRVGDPVKAGDVVARLDPASFAEAARQAEAALAGATAERKAATTALARSKQVFDAGIAPRQEVDDARTRLEVATAAEASARAALAEARRVVDRTVLASPLDGVVLAVLARPGELVDGTGGTAVVEVADLSRLELVADLPAAELARLAVGAEATVVLAGLEEEPFAAKVAAVAPVLDRQTGLGAARLALTLPAGLRPPVGAAGSATVPFGPARPGLFVPTPAVTRAASGASQVAVCADGKVSLREVVAGRVEGELIEVTGALAATDRVVVAPALGLVDGATIVESERGPPAPGAPGSVAP